MGATAVAALEIIYMMDAMQECQGAGSAARRLARAEIVATSILLDTELAFGIVSLLRQVFLRLCMVAGFLSAATSVGDSSAALTEGTPIEPSSEGYSSAAA